MVETLNELSEFFKTGGPYAVSAVMFLLYAWERRSHAKTRRECRDDTKGLQQDLLGLAMNSERNKEANTAALRSLKEVLKEIDRRVPHGTIDGQD